MKYINGWLLPICEPVSGEGDNSSVVDVCGIQALCLVFSSREGAEKYAREELKADLRPVEVNMLLWDSKPPEVEA